MGATPPSTPPRLTQLRALVLGLQRAVEPLTELRANSLLDTSGLLTAIAPSLTIISPGATPQTADGAIAIASTRVAELLMGVHASSPLLTWVLPMKHAQPETTMNLGAMQSTVVGAIVIVGELGTGREP